MEARMTRQDFSSFRLMRGVNYFAISSRCIFRGWFIFIYLLREKERDGAYATNSHLVQRERTPSTFSKCLAAYKHGLISRHYLSYRVLRACHDTRNCWGIRGNRRFRENVFSGKSPDFLVRLRTLGGLRRENVTDLAGDLSDDRRPRKLRGKDRGALTRNIACLKISRRIKSSRRLIAPLLHRWLDDKIRSYVYLNAISRINN